jgi:hypothetical protein
MSTRDTLVAKHFNTPGELANSFVFKFTFCLCGSTFVELFFINFDPLYRQDIWQRGQHQEHPQLRF